MTQADRDRLAALATRLWCLRGWDGLHLPAVPSDDVDMTLPGPAHRRLFEAVLAPLGPFS
jgi:hypothetical protein